MKDKTTLSQLKSFGILIGIVFPLLFGIILPYIYGHSSRTWPIIVGIPFIIIGLIYPKILKWPYKLWMLIGKILGWINSRIILGLIYILIVQPIAIIMKIFKYDPLKLTKKANGMVSYREIKNQTKTDLRKIF